MLLEIFRGGLKLVQEISSGFRAEGEWAVSVRPPYRGLFNFDRKLRFLFLERPLPKIIHPRVLEAMESGRLASPPETWPAEYHGCHRMVTAFILEKLKARGFSEDTALEFFGYILNVPENEWPKEINDFLLDALQGALEMSKARLHALLAERTDPQFADDLLNTAQLKKGDLRELAGILARNNTPVIHLPEKEGESEDSALAQMCVWALRQGVTDDNLDEFLLRYVERVGGDRESAGVVTMAVRDKWKAPFRPGTFPRFVCLQARQWKAWRAEIPVADIDEARRWRLGQKKAFTVNEAVASIGCPHRTLYHWLKAGKVPGRQVFRRITEAETIVQVSCELDSEGLQQAERLWRLVEARKAGLTQVIANHTGISRREAQRRLKRWLEQGLSLSEIYQKLRDEREKKAD